MCMKMTVFKGHEGLLTSHMENISFTCFFLASSPGFNWLIYCIILTSEGSCGK